MRNTSFFTLACFTGVLSLFADEGVSQDILSEEGEALFFHEQPTMENLIFEDSPMIAKAEKKKPPASKAPLSDKTAEPVVGSESEVIIQVQPGSRVIVRTVGAAPQQIEAEPSQAILASMKKEEAKTQAPDSGSKKPGWDAHRGMQYNHGWSLDGEFLYWKVAQEGLEWVTAPNTTIPVADQNKVSQTLGKYKSAHLNWNPGVRVGAGYTFQSDGWQLFGEYTYYHSHGHSSVTKPSDLKFIFPTFTAIATTPFTSAESEINLTYNASDLLLSHSFFASERILLKFSMGATAAWIEENWHFRYVANVVSHDQNNWNFRGGGARVKFDNYWHLGKGFGLFNKLSAAALLGSFHYNTRSSIKNFTSNTILNPVEKATYKNSVILPQTYIALGADWSREFTRVALTIALGVEATTWFNLHQVYKCTTHAEAVTSDRKDLRNVSNVNLYGGTLRIGLDF